MGHLLIQDCTVCLIAKFSIHVQLLARVAQAPFKCHYCTFFSQVHEGHALWMRTEGEGMG